MDHATLLPILLLLAVGSPSSAQPPAPAADAERQLRRMSQELLDAIAPGETAFWERYLDERFLHMDENGVVRTKAELLAELQPLPPGLVGRIEIDTYRVVFTAYTAVAAVEVQEHLDYHGQVLRSRFRSLDTWRRTSDGWRLLAQHVSAVLEDPPAVILSRDELCTYQGVYSLTPEIRTTLRCTGDGLVSVRTDRPAVTYLPELRDVFFAPGQPRTRRIFVRDAAGEVVAFVDRREGEDVRWTKQPVEETSGG